MTMDIHSVTEPRPRDRLSGDTIVVGIDVGSTTVKAVVVDPATQEILWSDYQRHETRQAEKTLELLVAIGGEFEDIRARHIRMFITGSGFGPAARAARRALRPGGQRRHDGGRPSAPGRPLGHRARRPGRQDHPVSGERKDRRQARHRVDERQVRVGHWRDDRQVHDQGGHGSGRCVPPALGSVEAPPRRRQVRRLRGDRHRQPGQVRHSRRTRFCARWPTPSCRRTCRS